MHQRKSREYLNPHKVATSFRQEMDLNYFFPNAGKGFNPVAVITYLFRYRLHLCLNTVLARRSTLFCALLRNLDTTASLIRNGSHQTQHLYVGNTTTWLSDESAD